MREDCTEPFSSLHVAVPTLTPCAQGVPSTVEWLVHSPHAVCTRHTLVHSSHAGALVTHGVWASAPESPPKCSVRGSLSPAFCAPQLGGGRAGLTSGGLGVSRASAQEEASSLVSMAAQEGLR